MIGRLKQLDRKFPLSKMTKNTSNERHNYRQMRIIAACVMHETTIIVCKLQWILTGFSALSSLRVEPRPTGGFDAGSHRGSA
jgi:hypothetical protein